MDRTNADSSNSMYTNVLGRTFTAQSTAYDLPADAQEHNRLDSQHDMLKVLVNGLYFPSDLVKKTLDPTDCGKRCGVMDVGTGSGIWAVEMAKEFPSADVVGMDLVYPMTLSETPFNCRFEIGDANLDWGHYAEAFDVVHMRCVTSGIKDFKGLLHNVAQTLRPQGVILLVSPHSKVYSETKENLNEKDEGTPGWCAVAALANAVGLATMERGGATAVVAEHWTRWLAEIPYYTNVGEREIWVPIGPWEEGLDESGRTAAELLRQNIMELISSWLPKLLEKGYDKELIDRWSSAARKEVRTMERKMYLLCKFSWATRTRAPWSPL
ncbi:hypothetical protein FRC01_007692 [Tulasnella sp. 417]|nr:hypothetical protein FRC01_007692 [Tulasnella sp. 417]